MNQIGKNLLTIFYFPLVALTFIFILIVGLSFFKPLVDDSVQPITDGTFTQGSQIAQWHNQKTQAPQKPLMAQTPESLPVLSAESGEKKIDINLTSQTLTAYEPNGSVFMQVPISSGLWAATPTGTFRIWVKLRYTVMSGGSKALGTYYYLPNVPCTQYFYKGYGLHGTYWHNNFGHPMSHGCVNMYTPDACRLFEWTSPSIAAGQNSVKPTAEQSGTPVVIHY